MKLEKGKELEIVVRNEKYEDNTTTVYLSLDNNGNYYQRQKSFKSNKKLEKQVLKALKKIFKDYKKGLEDEI